MRINLSSSTKIKKDCPLCAKYGIALGCPICNGAGFVLTTDPVAKMKKRNDRSRETASRSKKPFGIYDKKVIADFSIPTAKAAKRLRRSIKSIESARNRLRKELKDG